MFKQIKTHHAIIGLVVLAGIGIWWYNNDKKEKSKLAAIPPAPKDGTPAASYTGEYTNYTGQYTNADGSAKRNK